LDSTSLGKPLPGQTNMEETSSAKRIRITFQPQKEAVMKSKHRRMLLYTMLISLFLGGSMPVTAGLGQPASVCQKLKPCQLLGQSAAEGILGQSARLPQETSEIRGDVRQCMCAYKGVSPDKETGQDSALFFLLEEKEANPSAEQASQVLASTKDANALDHSILDLKGVGDEAFLLSNDSNSHLIMARRGTIILRLQVKRAAGTRSLEELKAFAKKVSKLL
jgi:hypothetical protein